MSRTLTAAALLLVIAGVGPAAAFAQQITDAEIEEAIKAGQEEKYSI